MSHSDAAHTMDDELARLIHACAARDRQALKRLYDLMAGQMLASMVRILRRRALAEEALQDVFVSIWQRAAQFEGARGPARIWLMAIARHRAIDVLRSERVDLYREADVEALPQPVMEVAEGGC